MSSKFFVQEDLSRAAKSRRRELEKLMRSIKAREPERRSTLLCFFFVLLLFGCCHFIKTREPERRSKLFFFVLFDFYDVLILLLING